jgi:outer membrane protein assembly factor BamE (lipoprotein component of BamABCDE complex)
MKIILTLASLALAAVSPVFAQPTTDENVATILSAESDVSVARGMSREAVTLMLGVPSETVGSNVWVYWNFRGKGAPQAANFDTLVLVFAGDRLTTLRLCESKPMRELIAKMKSGANPKPAAVTKK